MICNNIVKKNGRAVKRRWRKTCLYNTLVRFDLAWVFLFGIIPTTLQFQGSVPDCKYETWDKGPLSKPRGDTHDSEEDITARPGVTNFPAIWKAEQGNPRAAWATKQEPISEQDSSVDSPQVQCTL